MLNQRVLFFGIAGLTFTVFLSTLAPSITWRHSGADSGDLAAAVAVKGVPHPPGYPTYLWLGDLFQLIPLGDPAYRLNLLSATSAALAAALVALLVYYSLSSLAQAGEALSPTTGRTLPWLCAAVAALSLAFSDLFWSQATITEVYALHTLFAAGLLYGRQRVRLKNATWLGPLLALVMGLSAGNHLSIVLLWPFVGLGLMHKAGWSWRLAALSLPAFFLGLAIYATIPLRAAALPPVNWGVATDWSSFRWLVSGELYRQYLFSLPLELLPARLAAELRLLGQAFLWWGLPVGLLGLERMIRHRPLDGWGSLLTFSLISIYTLGYDTTDSYVYLLPALVLFAWWIGWGLYDIEQTVTEQFGGRKRAGRWVRLAFLLLPLMALGLNYPQQNLRSDTEALDFARQSLDQVEPRAIIITDNDLHTFSLWYASYALHQRPDVAIINPNLLPHAWYHRTLRQHYPHLQLPAPAFGSLPALLDLNRESASLYYATLAASPPDIQGYTFSPVNSLYQATASAE
ncbi:MAG TPA: DUF2723 domain-containing protein [Anaerolineae bacterium]|nr:DUF2723 domain-containing protein [Anaerolineae bacterium]